MGFIARTLVRCVERRAFDATLGDSNRATSEFSNNRRWTRVRLQHRHPAVGRASKTDPSGSDAVRCERSIVFVRLTGQKNVRMSLFDLEVIPLVIRPSTAPCLPVCHRWNAPTRTTWNEMDSPPLLRLVGLRYSEDLLRWSISSSSSPFKSNGSIKCTSDT